MAEWVRGTGAVSGCCLNGEGSDPDSRCKTYVWEGLHESFVSHPR